VWAVRQGRGRGEVVRRGSRGSAEAQKGRIQGECEMEDEKSMEVYFVTKNGLLAWCGAITCLLLAASTLAYAVGHIQGVKNHDAGRWVVVKMPDGTDRVCKVKGRE